MNFEQPSGRFYSVGHSTRNNEEFIRLLTRNGISTLADVRRYPASKRHPHFSGEQLARSLGDAGIAYLHIEALGGHRKPAADSPNAGWRNPSFRAYADHMATMEFRGGVNRLFGLTAPVAFMCAEAVPWRCHRNLLADELTRRGAEVLHILSAESIGRHEMNPAAVDRGSFLVYRDPSMLF